MESGNQPQPVPQTDCAVSRKADSAGRMWTPTGPFWRRYEREERGDALTNDAQFVR